MGKKKLSRYARKKAGLNDYGTQNQTTPQVLTGVNRQHFVGAACDVVESRVKKSDRRLEKLVARSGKDQRSGDTGQRISDLIAETEEAARERAYRHFQQGNPYRGYGW